MEDEVKGKENGKELCNGKDTVEQESDAFDENGGEEEQKEYEDLDQELDRLNTCLDTIEDWNDSLHSRIKDFLETIQQERKEHEVNETEEIDTSETK